MSHETGDNSTAKEVRGSTLFLLGRVISTGIGFLTQVLILRYLSKADYGAFAYALVAISLVQSTIVLGLERVDRQFLSTYDERRDYGRLAGTIVMELGTIASLGLAVTVLLYAFQGSLAGTVVDDRQAVSLLLILILLAPVQAVDDLTMSLFGVFSRPRAVFFRRWILNPTLRLVVVVVLILSESSVTFLATGYVVAGALGVTLYVGYLVRVLRERGLLAHFRRSSLSLPFREVFGSSVPLMSIDLGVIVMHTLGVFLLGFYWDTVEVGALRAVFPLAIINLLVLRSFSFLYTPIAARLRARDELEGIGDLHRQSAVWITVLSFPVFAVTFCLAEPVVVALFEARYASSAPYLALLALGYYFQACMGLQALTLQVFGRVRWITTANLATAAVNVVLYMLLIPPYGAMGAAIGTCASLILRNVLLQAGLRLRGEIPPLEWSYWRVYVVVAASTVALGLLQLALAPPLAVGLALAALASLIVLASSRSPLRAGETFPELMRIPFARRLVGGSAKSR